MCIQAIVQESLVIAHLSKTWTASTFFLISHLPDRIKHLTAASPAQLGRCLNTRHKCVVPFGN
jgi:hypothetical protein